MSLNSRIQLGDNYSSWEDMNYSFYWEGIIFIKGVPSGVDSIKKFSNIMAEMGIEKACRFLSGVFFLVIQNKTDDRYYSLVDNSGLFQAFYSNTHISTSFLKLVQIENLKVDDLNKRSVVEFIHCGYIFFNRTFFKSINKIDGTQILSLSQERLSVLTKEIPDIFCEVEQEPFLTIFEKIAASLRNQNISLDLTGGMDTRLLAVVFNHFGLEFETAVSGVEGHPDVDISCIVAKKLGCKHSVTYHSIENLDEDIEESFNICDGLMDILEYLRLLQHQRNRANRKIDLMISGVGGEIFKDFFWVQDFPFYNKKHANIERLFNLRIRPIAPKHSYFSNEYVKRSKGFRNDFLRDLAFLLQNTNTKTYDNIFFKCRWKERAGRFTTNNNKILKCYTPFLDIDLVRIAVNLPRRKRLKDGFHRRIIALLNPDVAKLRTSRRGYIGIIRYSFFLRDIIKYFTVMGRRLINIFFPHSPDNPEIYRRVKESKVSQRYTEFLHDSRILNKEIDITCIDDEFLGRFVTLAKLVEVISDKAL